MGKTFEKQIKTIEDQGQKHIDTLESLKPKEQTKPIEDKPNNQSKATIMFNDLINKRKKTLSELHDSFDYNNLKFEYVDPAKDAGFYEYKDSKERFNAIKNNQIKFSEEKNKRNEFLNKLNKIKIGKKDAEQKEVINNHNKFYNSREEVINFLENILKCHAKYHAKYDARQNKTERMGLKILSPKQMLQRLPIALAQVKAGNNSESLLNEIRQIVYSLYQSKQITKKYTLT